VRREDCRIRILGRAGDVLNVGGAKIAVAPLEQAVAQLLGLENVCLFQHVDAQGTEQLIVVLETSALPDGPMIKRAAARLPVLGELRFETVTPFPRTPAGLRKIRRAELRKMVVGANG
jgi:acyl-coenzyme A synthetase/AMP-(fatty) acid ligase